MIGVETFTEHWGWLGVILYILYKEALPVVLKKWFPARMKQAEVLARREDSAIAFDREQEERRTKAQELSAQALVGLKDVLKTLSDQMRAHDEFTRDSVSAMFQHVAATNGVTVTSRRVNHSPSRRKKK